MPASRFLDQSIDCIADTSVVIGLLRRDPRIVAALDQQNFTISFITAAELALGIRKANDPITAAEKLGLVLRGRRGEAIYPSKTTPLLYAEVCHDLERRGVRIPTNDIWIAAVAIENDLPLIARDEHFARVAGLDFIPC